MNVEASTASVNVNTSTPLFTLKEYRITSGPVVSAVKLSTGLALVLEISITGLPAKSTTLLRVRLRKVVDSDTAKFL